VDGCWLVFFGGGGGGGGRGSLSNQTQNSCLKNVFCLGVRGLTTSFCIVYDYTTSGHKDLYSVYVLYMKYMYTAYTVRMHFCTVYINSVQYIYLFIMQ